MDAMDKYRNMSNIDHRKIEPKIGFVSIKTLIIMLVAPTMSFNMLQSLNFPLIASLIITILIVGFAIYCLAKTKNNPVEGNFKLLLYAVVMNKKRYFPLDRIKSYQDKNKKSLY